MKKPINEEIKRMQIIAGILKEEEIDNTSDEEKIDMWYWDSNPEIENLSQKQIEDGIKAHQEEWLGSKQFYDSIEDYFEDVESRGDWYGNEFDDDDDDLYPGTMGDEMSAPTSI